MSRERSPLDLFYARLLMQNEPELEGFFETRHAQADD